MKLYLYFARRFAWSVFWMFAVFAFLAALIEMVEVLRRFSAAAPGMVQIVELTALRVPRGLYQILPLIVILATLGLFLSLAKSRELVVTRAAGCPPLRALAAPLLVALALGVLAVVLFNPIVAATSSKYETLSNRLLNGQASVLSVGGEGLWLRQGGADGQTVIRAERANKDGTLLHSVTFYGFSRDGVATFRIDGEQAELEPGAWVVTGAKVWRFDGDGNPERTALTRARLRLPSDLTQEEIRDGFGTPSSVAIWDLPRFIHRLKAAGFSARRHEVWFQAELSQPLLLVTMVLIGAGFTMRHNRMDRTGLKVLGALLFGFGLYFLRNFTQILGENGQLPVVLAAWSVPVAGAMLALAFLLHVEDG